MTSEDENFIFAIIQVVAPTLKRLNNSHKFLIIGFVASLGRNYYMREKNYKISLINFKLLKNWIFVSYMIGKKLIQNYLT